MVSCSVALSDEKSESAVKAVLSLLGIGCENGSILITDSVPADVSDYSAVIVLSQSRIAPEEKGNIRVLRMPLSYGELIGVIGELSAVGSDTVRSGTAEKAPSEEPVLPEIRDGEITWQKKSVRLTEKEMRLFEYLYAARGRIVPRDELIGGVWDGYTGDANVADVYISYLRKKLTPLFGQGVLVTVRGQGYLLNLPG